MGKLQDLGELMVFGVKLQFYFIYRMLIGGIVFGIFPGFLFVYRVIRSCIEERMISHIGLKGELQRLEKTEVIKVNICGWLIFLFLWVMGINLRVSSIFLGEPLLRIVMIIFMIVLINTALYILPILSKYELPIRQYFFQAFLLGFISIIDSIAIALAVSIAFAISLILPPVGLFAGIPLLFLPYVWFSRNAIGRLEAVLYKKVDFLAPTTNEDFLIENEDVLREE